MVSKRLGGMLAQLRKAKGLTQIDLAKKANVTQAYIAMLECGDKTNPSLTILQRLAKALKVTVGELVK